MTALLSVPTRRAAWRAAWSERLPERALVELDAATPAQLSEVRHALVWRPPPGLWARLPKLELAFALGAGVDGILSGLGGAASLPASVPLIRLHDAGMAAQMVDYHVYAALHFQRDFDDYARDQGAERWRPRDVRGGRLRVGVLGLGAMGLAVARALAGLGFPVAGWTRRGRGGVDDGVERYAGLEGLDELLARTDLLMALLPHTPETAGLLDAARLARLPEGAAIVNAGRGSLIDEAALLAAIDGGRLRGAFLDVSAVEPLPEGHPFWAHPRIRVTPHVAAQTLIGPAIEQVAAGLEALEAGRSLASLPGLVDRSVGY
ncbi:probable phosphoglycerate dehydrogenase [Plesiocystis pacifica SIR-1]|uniref:Probable phosphoglycerate dehydrogenase n=1 Tax=Plesiocystis pacifica SIR-1 TaxID=391625 RepID=A6G7T9_9BACT|nr:glyoxylate/hydroxypyruvate reductase A [Plesiocystis pacifica]EDM78032.1 probable phosphoglycerate dehydrogenase [Plesiocystis pacifica SIR-1]